MPRSSDDKHDLQSYIENPARLVIDQTPDCDVCNEALTFVLRDNYHHFSLPLSTLLECLYVAEKQGEVPALPDGWWRLLHRQFPALSIID